MHNVRHIIILLVQFMFVFFCIRVISRIYRFMFYYCV